VSYFELHHNFHVYTIFWFFVLLIQKSLIVLLAHMHTIYLDQIHSSISTDFIALFSFLGIKYSYIHSPHLFSPSPILLIPSSPKGPILHSCYSFLKTRFHIQEVTCNIFVIWLILLHMMISGSIHFSENNTITFFFFMTNMLLGIYITYSLSIHWLMGT
jgi:hypothetical protein